jgi:hypothetical protein
MPNTPANFSAKGNTSFFNVVPNFFCVGINKLTKLLFLFNELLIILVFFA